MVAPGPAAAKLRRTDAADAAIPGPSKPVDPVRLEKLRKPAEAAKALWDMGQQNPHRPKISAEQVTRVAAEHGMAEETLRRLINLRDGCMTIFGHGAIHAYLNCKNGIDYAPLTPDLLRAVQSRVRDRAPDESFRVALWNSAVDYNVSVAYLARCVRANGDFTRFATAHLM